MSPESPAPEALRLRTLGAQGVVQTPSPAPAKAKAPTRQLWRPKVTAYRLFVSISTVALGLAKAITSVLGLSYTSVTLEWVSGVVLVLILFVLGVYEEIHRARTIWLFHYDLLNIIPIKRLRSYNTDEKLPSRSSGVAITGYRILVSMTAATFGFVKAINAYGSQTAQVTTAELMFGVVVTLSLYWLGLYEKSPVILIPGLFQADYTIHDYEVIQGDGVTIRFLILVYALLSSVIVLNEDPNKFEKPAYLSEEEIRQLFDVLTKAHQVTRRTSLISLYFVLSGGLYVAVRFGISHLQPHLPRLGGFQIKFSVAWPTRLVYWKPFIIHIATIPQTLFLISLFLTLSTFCFSATAVSLLMFYTMLSNAHSFFMFVWGLGLMMATSLFLIGISCIIGMVRVTRSWLKGAKEMWTALRCVRPEGGKLPK